MTGRPACRPSPVAMLEGRAQLLAPSEEGP
jgi:hypothetical protein